MQFDQTVLLPQPCAITLVQMSCCGPGACPVVGIHTASGLATNHLSLSEYYGTAAGPDKESPHPIVFHSTQCVLFSSWT